jgi:parvulin-like peptidyl-prolyl isomerase
MISLLRAPLIGCILLLSGCGGGDRGEPVVLRPDAFFRPSTLQQPENRRRTAIDQPESLTYDNARIDLLNQAPPEPEVRTLVTSIPPEAERLIPSATAPSTRPLAPMGTGVAMAVGRVAVEVNGQPVFSKKVLQPIEPDLAADAREMDPESFRKSAAGKIRNQLDFLIRTELEVAAARRNLTPAEVQVAEAQTMAWRQRQITEAGGSIEQARQKAIGEGTTFEEKVEEEFRTNLVRAFYSKRIFPRVQVTADDMRRYYDRNMEREFTSRAAAQFRLIKVDVKKVGDRAKAEQMARELADRARGGEDFAAVARDYNDDARLRNNGGEVGSIEKGAFALTAVEDAVWKLNPGEVTDPIEEKNAFYVAKLEQKGEARVQSFDEEAVQDKIRSTLRGRQFQELRDKQREQLLEGAVVNPYPPKVEPLLEIVMQKYPYWAMKQ